MYITYAIQKGDIMRVTLKLLAQLRRGTRDDGVTVRMHAKVAKYIRSRAIELGQSQSTYLEGIVLAEAASRKASDQEYFDMDLDHIREFMYAE